MRKHYTEAQRAELVALEARGEATPRVAGREAARRPVDGVLLAQAKRPAPGRADRSHTPAVKADRASICAAGASHRGEPGDHGPGRDAVIAVEHHFDAELLRAVVAALAGRSP